MNFDPLKPFNLPFLPPSINEDDLFSREFVGYLIKAHKSISDLNGTCRAIPSPYNLLMTIPALFEARDSSAIEGIHTTVEGILEAELKEEKDIDPATKEARRYYKALTKGYQSLKELNSLSTRTIKEIHTSLMLSNGGSFKKQVNTLQSDSGGVIYTPPTPDKTDDLMKNWNNYVNGGEETGVDFLIKIAISHYQFEAIHPFSDGNGRAGRIAIVLQMMLYKLLEYPVLYISGYLMKNRQEYNDLLLSVTQENKWIEFIIFFLKAFDQQAQVTKNVILDILNSKKETKQILKDKKGLTYSKDLLDHIFSHPITHATFLSKELNITYQTAGKYLSVLQGFGLLKKKASGRYNLYHNVKLLSCLST